MPALADGRLLLACLGLAAVAPLPLVRAAALLGAWVLLLHRPAAARSPALAVGLGAAAVLALSYGPALFHAAATPATRVAAALVLPLAAAAFGALAGAHASGGADGAPPPPPAPSPGPTALAALGALVVHAPGLGLPLHWMGDEDLHVGRTLVVLGLLAGPPLATGAAAGAAGAWLLRRRGRGLALLGAVAGAAVAVPLHVGLAAPSALPALTRYSALLAWLDAGLAASPATILSVAARHDPGWYRLGTLLAVAGAATAAARFAPLPAAGRVLVGLAVATLPTALYHGALLYLETQVAPLLAWVLLAGRSSGRPDRLPGGWAWLALLALPLAKDTALPAFLAIGGVSGALLLRARPGPRALALHAACFGFPLACVLLLRSLGRPFVPAPAQLLDLDPWRVGAAALVEQLGLALALVGLGAALSWRAAPGFVALCLGAAAASVVFFALDVREWWGYARFFLLVAAPLLALAGAAVAELGERGWTRATTAALGACVVGGLAASPMSLAGGREPYWGLFGDAAPVDLAYPWDEALALVPVGRPGDLVEVVGSIYPYDWAFYGRPRRVAWSARLWPEPFPVAPWRRAGRATPQGPLDEARALARTHLAAAATRPATLAVVVQLLPGDLASAWPEAQGDLERAGDVRRGACRLVVYVRRPSR